MHYQVFIPGEPGRYAEKLVEAGLPQLVEGSNQLDLPAGPDGKAGVLYAWPTHDEPDMGFKLDRQTWIPAAPWRDPDTGREWPAGRYVVGIWNDSPPAPEELERPDRFAGRVLPLGDGHEWILPVARRLPGDMVLTPTGPTIDVKDQFRGFWNKTAAWFQRAIEVEVISEVQATEAEWWDLLTSAMALNYRIVPEVISHLRLFDINTRIAALAVVLEHFETRVVALEIAEKKTGESPIPAG